MGALTPSFLMDLESRMQVISEREYSRLTSNLWWKMVTKTRTSGAKRDVLLWLLSTAQIRPTGSKGGNVAFEDLVSVYTEIETSHAGDGLKLHNDQLTDTDGNGMQLAAEWSAQIGAYMGYWPQKETARFLKFAHLLAGAGGFTGYDGKAFFATDHPVNPFLASAGTYANLLTGAPVAASGNTPYYPGTCPIDESVSVDVALQNLSKIMAYVSSYRMPNGEDPRFLRPRGILCPPRLFPRAVQLTNAKFIAQAATGGAAVGDVEALIKSLGYAMPVQADELSGFESDTTFFVVAEQIMSTELGGVIYTEREPFSIGYYGVQTEAELSRRREHEWLVDGRNSIAPGHPYLLIKCKGA